MSETSSFFPEMREDFLAAAKWLKSRSDSTGKLSVVDLKGWFIELKSSTVNVSSGRRASDLENRAPALCRKIVAARLGKVEKRGSHYGADRVATNVLLSSIAARVPIKPRHWGYGANIERLAKYVAGPPTASIATVVPQHCRLLLAYRQGDARPRTAFLKQG